MVNKLIARLRALVAGRDVDGELDDEVPFHVEMQTRTNVEAGMSLAQARRAALLSFGGVDQMREAARDTRMLWLDSIWRDVRFAVRGLRRNPGFTAAVVLTLGLGIGANTAIFSVVNSLVLRPLPVRDADRLTVLAVSRGVDGPPRGMSRLDVEDYRSQSDAFEDIAAHAQDFVGLSVDNGADRVMVTYVSGNYFPMLGLQPAVGRLIQSTEGRVAGADPVLVLSYDYWRRRFDGDPTVVGKAVRLNGRPFTIVGVAPEGFHGVFALLDTAAFVPLSNIAPDPVRQESWNDRADTGMRTIGRLKRGVTLEQARASLDVIGRRLAAQYPATNKDIRPRVFWETYARPEANAATVLPLIASIFLTLVVTVLLVACVNVAGLLLVRGTVRLKELTLRTALGASRLRIVQQLVTESVLLSLLGGALGVLIGAWATRMLSGVRLPGDMPVRLDLSFDWRVFAYVALVALLSGLVAGIVPALRVSATNPAQALHEGGRTVAASGGSHRLRDLLVVAQVAGALVILAVAGLFVRSLSRAQTIELGFQPDHVMNFCLDPGQLGYDQTRGASLFRDVLDRVRSLPGVGSASLAHTVPLGYWSAAQWLEKEGQALAPDDQGLRSLYNMVDADYQRVMGIRLVSGRWFTGSDEDGERPLAVVNEFLARRLWPGESPLGKRLRYRGTSGPFLEVIGVAGSGKYNNIFETPRAFYFTTHRQEYTSLRVLHVRTTGRPEDITSAVRREIRALAPDVALFDVITMERSLGGGNGFFLLTIGAAFAVALGLLGLALAVVGLYGVVAYSAGQRAHEIGIRMALGAERRDILRMVVGHGLWLVVTGSAVGIVCALGLSQLLGTVLFDVKPYDPLTYAAVVCLLVLVGMGACYVPARRATHVEPNLALRGE